MTAMAMSTARPAMNSTVEFAARSLIKHSAIPPWRRADSRSVTAASTTSSTTRRYGGREADIASLECGYGLIHPPGIDDTDDRRTFLVRGLQVHFDVETPVVVACRVVQNLPDPPLTGLPVDDQ